ncbi:hypothetical protein Hanom_Chr07g00668121 [Helianthus anomalus]
MQVIFGSANISKQRIEASMQDTEPSKRVRREVRMKEERKERRLIEISKKER